MLAGIDLICDACQMFFSQVAEQWHFGKAIGLSMASEEMSVEVKYLFSIINTSRINVCTMDDQNYLPVGY